MDSVSRHGRSRFKLQQTLPSGKAKKRLTKAEAAKKRRWAKLENLAKKAKEATTIAAPNKATFWSNSSGDRLIKKKRRQ